MAARATTKLARGFRRDARDLEARANRLRSEARVLRRAADSLSQRPGRKPNNTNGGGAS
jgi:hypothetical protein